MGKLTAFYIIIAETEQPIFFPGQAMNGSVVINLNSSMDMRAVRIKFHGEGYVHWSESHRSGKNTTTRYYSAKEIYFDHSLSLFGKGSGSYENMSELAAGRTVFPFSFQLPVNLPSSFEGAHGHVRYYIKATIDKPWKFDHNTKVAFTVLDTLDLNLENAARLPVSNNDSKTLCCLCCASGPIQAQLHLDRGGYVPGEYILINASVENMSSQDMLSTKAILIQSVQFHATTKTRTRTKEVAQINGPGCRAGSSIGWNNERLQIPPLPPSELRFCNIITIDYYLQFVVVVPAGSINLKVNVPVLLGSIPLQGLSPYCLPPDAGPFAEASAPPMPALPTAPTSFEPPPPSYAAAVGGSVNIKDEDDNEYLMGEATFTPQYTYYDWSKSAFTYTNK